MRIGAAPSNMFGGYGTPELLAALEQTAPLSPGDVPAYVIYWSAKFPYYPPFPGNYYQLPAWPLGNGDYVLDDLGFDYSPPSDEASRSTSRFGNFNGFLGNPGGGAPMDHYSSNDLWLEINSVSNYDFVALGLFTTPYVAADLTINLPATNQTGSYGLYVSPDLSSITNWAWWLNTQPGQTNVVATNLPVGNGFLRLGPLTAIRPGFDQQNLFPNDDYYTTSPVPIGFNINLFGTNRSSLYVNNNGNVTFDSYLPNYTPFSLSNVGDDILAPFWADVDTTGAGSLPLTYGTNTVDGHLAFGVSWIRVGYYISEFDKLNTFQLVIIHRPSDVYDQIADPTTDFDLEFNYQQIQWETGDASEGTNGLGGSSARVGFSEYGGTNFEFYGGEIPGTFLDSNNITGLIHSNFNSSMHGRYIFHFRSGYPIETP